MNTVPGKGTVLEALSWRNKTRTWGNFSLDNHQAFSTTYQRHSYPCSLVLCSLLLAIVLKARDDSSACCILPVILKRSHTAKYSNCSARYSELYRSCLAMPCQQHFCCAEAAWLYLLCVNSIALQVDISNSTANDLILHWAINGWKEPDKQFWPENTNAVDGKAVQTPFPSSKHIQLTFPEEKCPNRSISFPCRSALC